MPLRPPSGLVTAPDTAKSIGSENLTKPDLQARIAKAMAERSKRTGVNADRVVMELAKIAFVNAGDVIDAETATLKPDAAKEDTAAIQSVKVKPSERTAWSVKSKWLIS